MLNDKTARRNSVLNIKKTENGSENRGVARSDRARLTVVRFCSRYCGKKTFGEYNWKRIVSGSDRIREMIVSNTGPANLTGLMLSSYYMNQRPHLA